MTPNTTGIFTAPANPLDDSFALKSRQHFTPEANGHIANFIKTVPFCGCFYFCLGSFIGAGKGPLFIPNNSLLTSSRGMDAQFMATKGLLFLKLCSWILRANTSLTLCHFPQNNVLIIVLCDTFALRLAPIYVSLWPMILSIDVYCINGDFHL